MGFYTPYVVIASIPGKMNYLSHHKSHEKALIELANVRLHTHVYELSIDKAFSDIANRYSKSIKRDGKPIDGFILWILNKDNPQDRFNETLESVKSGHIMNVVYDILSMLENVEVFETKPYVGARGIKTAIVQWLEDNHDELINALEKSLSDKNNVCSKAFIPECRTK